MTTPPPAPFYAHQHSKKFILLELLKNEMKALGKTANIEVKAANGYLHAPDVGEHYLFGAKLIDGEFVPDPKATADWIIFTPK